MWKDGTFKIEPKRFESVRIKHLQHKWGQAPAEIQSCKKNSIDSCPRHLTVFVTNGAASAEQIGEGATHKLNILKDDHYKRLCLEKKKRKGKPSKCW